MSGPHRNANTAGRVSSSTFHRDLVRWRTKSEPKPTAPSGPCAPAHQPAHQTPAPPERLLGSHLTPDPSRTTTRTPRSSPRHLGRSRGLTRGSGVMACGRPLCRPAREGSNMAVARAVRPNLSGSSDGADTIPTLKVCPGPIPSPPRPRLSGSLRPLVGIQEVVHPLKQPPLRHGTRAPAHKQGTGPPPRHRVRQRTIENDAYTQSTGR